MNALKAATVTAMAAMALAGAAQGAATRGFSLDVVLDGGVRPEYRARGTVYVEAVRGRPYVLRITNPLPCWVGVALAVDGLNTIDARRSDARSAAKWLLRPYETIEIPGWQVTGSDARQFFFTGERSSYGAWLGKTDNLGVIEAVFYRQRPRPIEFMHHPAAPHVEGRAQELGSDSAGAPGGAPGEASGGESRAERMKGAAPSPQVDGKLSDEYAATGIGERRRHEVEWMDLDLEDRPAAVVRIRYEFRDQLVRMGVLSPTPDPLTRREHARGFSGGYCPDPFGGR